MSTYRPGVGVRDVNVKDSGNDADDGSNVLFAKKTLSSAVEAANNLNPTPSLGVPASITDSGASAYECCLNVPDNVQVALNSSSIQGLGGDVVKAGANAQLSVLTISTSTQIGDTAYSSNGKSRIALDARAIILNGVEQIGCSINGTTDQAFQNVGQILARFDDSIAVDITSTGNEPRYLQYNEINISGDNSIGINCDAPATGAAAFRVGAITYENNPLTLSTGANSIGINVVKGLMAGYAAEVNMDTFVNVGIDGDLILDNLLGAGNIINDGKLNITLRRLTGDIINSGSLTIRVDEHVSGNIVNSGILNGEINGIRYGSWVDSDDQGRVFSRSGNVSTSSQVVGYLTLNTNTDTIESIIGSYFQSSSSSRQYNLEIVDADTLATYYSASNTKAASGPHSFDAKVGVGLPVASIVNLVVLQSRTGGGGLSSGQCTIEFTRI